MIFYDEMICFMIDNERSGTTISTLKWLGGGVLVFGVMISVKWKKGQL